MNQIIPAMDSYRMRKTDISTVLYYNRGIKGGCLFRTMWIY